MSKILPYTNLVGLIGDLLAQGREQAGRAVNTILVQTYWQIGRHIVEFEQAGKATAQYGSEVLVQLARDLTQVHGKGFSRSNLVYMRKLYLAFPKREPQSHKLTWSHYYELLKSDTYMEIQIYQRQCEL